MFFIDISLKNTDLTSDQTASIKFYAIDKSGMYSSISGSNDESCNVVYISAEYQPLYNQIGPGQEISRRICLALPEIDAHGKREFYVLVVGNGNNVVKVYGVKIMDLSNCIATQYSQDQIIDYGDWNSVIWTVGHEYQLSIPGSVSVTASGHDLSFKLAHRLIFQGSAETTIDIQVLPTRPEVILVLKDPSGNEIIRSDQSTPGEITKLANINLLCNGQYNFYLIPHIGNGSQDYTVTITVK
jgi:hypothetical protein